MVAGLRTLNVPIRAKRFARTAVVLLAISSILHPAVALAADSFRAGDAVEVFFLGKWRPAVVVNYRSGMVLAEYEFAGGPKRNAFKQNEVRLAYEADALSKPRFWRDASGTFRQRAVLLSIDGDKVTLRKPDMAEVQVPITALCDSDQRFIQRLEKEAGPGGGKPPQPPPIEQFTVAQDGGTAAFGGGSGRAALTPDPVPAYLTMKHGGVGFVMEDFWDRIGAVLPIGGPDGWLLAAVEHQSPSEPLPTRLLWTSLERQQIEGRQLLPPGEVVLDYHPPSHRLLTYATVETPENRWGKSVLTLWEVLPTDKQVKPVVRWNAEPSERRPGEPWARLIDGNAVVQRWTDHDFVVWDTSGKRMRYRTNQESFFAPAPTLSGGRKYLFMPEDKQVRILEIATGRLVSTLPVDDGAAAVAASEDGRWAAVLGRGTLTVWDLTSADAAPNRYQAEAIGTPFSATLNWVGNRRVMASSGHGGLVLFSLEHKLALWNYQFDMDAVREAKGRRVREIIAGHLVYAASVSAGGQRGLAVGAVQLPGPKVDEAAAALDPESLMIIKPGTAVRLDVRAGGDSARVQAALEREIQANGWTLSGSASIVVVAEMKIGDMQQVTYRSLGGRGMGGEETVSITPHISQVRIEVGSNVAWQAGTSTGAPPMMRLQEGETVQGEVNRWQRPNVDFFEKIDIPEKLLDPTKRNGIGTTQVTNRGLIPRETPHGAPAGIPGTVPPPKPPGAP